MQQNIDRVKQHSVLGESLTVYAKDGKCEYGWEHEQTTDVFSKLIFAYLQARDVKKNKPEYMRLLNKTLKKALGVKKIYWNIGDWEGYIDHQSSASEGANDEMFESQDALTRFIFSDESYIQGGNDNDC